jgi:hypothetical protein
MVSSTRFVSGVVIDWTQIGLSPPTTLSPTATSRVLWRWNVCLYVVIPPILCKDLLVAGLSESSPLS